MKNLLTNIEEILLMGPGPSNIHNKVYEALSKYTIGHMDSYFLRIADETKTFLQRLLNTDNALTLPVSGTGSAGMEACFVNLIEPGDKVLILINGVFGKRMFDVAERLGADVDCIEFEWGTPVNPNLVEEKIQKTEYKIVSMVHAETSTGVMNPAKEIGEILKDNNSLYILDTVTSLGGVPVEVDKWSIDALYSGSQKCLSCPPGLAPLTFSQSAVDSLKNRKTKVPNWYLDMSMIIQYWDGNNRVYHHTAPINMIYALYQALLLIFEEGTINVFNRHKENHNKLVSGIEKIGLEMLVDPVNRLPMLNAIKIPSTIRDESLVRTKLRDDFKIEIGAGLGSLAGKIWRIGIMGHTSREENVERVLSALKKTL